MKRITMRIGMILLMFLLQLNISCSTGSDSSDLDIDYSTSDWECGTHNGKQLWTGPKGGCYYINSNGNKTYVERSECKC